MERNIMTECYSCTHKKEVPGNCHIKCNKPDKNMVGDSHGIKNGWFYYPFLFDPVWKKKLCENYQNHEAISHAISQAVSLENANPNNGQAEV